MTYVGEPEKSRPVRLFALGLGLGFGALVLLAMVFFLPVEWSEAKLRFRLWRAGARTVLWEKHRGFTQDRCGGRPTAECECVWLIHGMGDSVVTWRKFFFAPDAFGNLPVRVYAIDLPGHGGSLRRHDVKDYRVSNMAREIDAEIARTTACSKNALVGNSFGGWVAARMVLESPTRYSRLVLVDSGGLKSSDTATQDLFKTSTVESLKEFQKRAYFKPRELTEREWAFAADRMKKSSVGEVREAQVADDLLDGVLGKITVDTVVVWGDGDRIISREATDEFVKGIRRSRLVVLPQCGHLPQKECPEKLFPVIRDALTPQVKAASP